MDKTKNIVLTSDFSGIKHGNSNLAKSFFKQKPSQTLIRAAVYKSLTYIEHNYMQTATSTKEKTHGKFCMENATFSSVNQSHRRVLYFVLFRWMTIGQSAILLPTKYISHVSKMRGIDRMSSRGSTHILIDFMTQWNNIYISVIATLILFPNALPHYTLPHIIIRVRKLQG